MIERHPLKPFLPENAKVLFLGSFPPPKKRWCMEFYYPNFLNDHWRLKRKWKHIGGCLKKYFDKKFLTIKKFVVFLQSRFTIQRR